mgnify:CR=1 FL=1|tara:strand:- start:2337 stop:3125 length:789 start_codon:yes stop_codon:yes gene_type:complete
MPRRYIGITDFMNKAQAELMADVWLSNHHDLSKLTLHVGVMMSRKTLNGLETKWTNAFPPNEAVRKIFAIPWMFNCLHYADYDQVDLTSNLRKALEFGGLGMNALQLDMVWPDPTDLACALVLAGREGDMEVVLQLNSNAMEAEGDDPERVAARIEKQYDGLITHVLLDKSMGQGLGMDANALIPYADAIAGRMPNMGLVAAGGLGPHTTHLVKPLLKRHPTISVDAQGQLRASGNALDPIDWERAAQYVRKMVDLMDETTR